MHTVRRCCGSRNPDPNVLYPGSRIQIFSIPDPGSASKNLSILTQKIGFYALGNMIRIRILFFSHLGSRGQKGTEFRTRNTAVRLSYGGLCALLEA
jgi:hypothetical protein